MLLTEVCDRLALTIGPSLILNSTDLHARNLAFIVPNLSSLDEEALMRNLKAPAIGEVEAVDSRTLEPNLPKYLVRPTCLRMNIDASLPRIKIIDFGEAFVGKEAPDRLHTPLVVRAPESIFGNTLDQ